MTVTPGTRLGPYEILAPIGAGGMGEVWKARDTRLERSVAVKILPPDLAGNAQFRLRFEREAKTISQLDHPNICTLFDVGDDYLVMEYLEGESLADRLARGPLPLGEVLRLGIQIAHALERAHRSGIVHRDLKPGNVMITRSGAKLLDFGLARSTSSPVTPIDATQQRPLTQEGTILGTFQYMSPEQIAGEEADARSDIFSFGAVLYEMLTGKRAFEGKTKTSVIAAIVGGEPRPASQLQPLTPAALEHVIAKCLAKERDERWQSAADIAGELDWIRSSTAVQTAAPARRAAFPFIVGMVLLLIVTSVAITMALWFERRLRVAEMPIRAELNLPPSLPLATAVLGPVALSPDARRVAILIGVMGKSLIAVRDLASGETRPLAATDGAAYPFWSADGKRIGFFANQKLKTISAEGGAIDVLCDAKQGRGGSWSRDGVIIYSPELQGPIYKINEGGGTPIQLTRPLKGWTHRNPTFLPDGKTFLYIGRDFVSMPFGRLYACSVDGGTPKVVLEVGSNAVVAGDRLLFVRNRNLVAQQFDPKALHASGTPVDIVEDVQYYNPRDLGNFAAAGNTIVYVPALTVPGQITIFDPTGHLVAQKGEPGNYRILGVSPDGSRLALAIGDGDVWMMQLDRGVLSRVTFADSNGATAAFSPDGSRLATSANTTGNTRISIASIDGGAPEQVIEFPKAIGVNGWSADGKYLLVTVQNLETAHDVGYIDLQQRKLVEVIKTPAEESTPALSPNGKWLAFSSLESGAPQVYVTSFPEGRGKWQATIEAGASPQWSRDGKQLFFVNAGKLWVTEVHDGAAPRFGTPSALAVPIIPNAPSTAGYAIMPDRRIVTLTRSGPTPPNAVHLITNWQKLLPQ